MVVVAAMVLSIASTAMAGDAGNVKMIIKIDDKGKITVHNGAGDIITGKDIPLEKQMEAIQNKAPTLKDKNIYTVVPCTIMITNPCIYYWIGSVQYEYCW